MANFSGSEAVVAGFKVIRAHPQAVLLWGAVYLLLCWLPQAIVTLLVWPDLAAFQAAAQDNALTAEQALPLQARLLGPILLAVPFLMLGLTLICGAVWRSILSPQDVRRGYLRFGRQEQLLLLCSLTLVFLLWLALVVASFVLGLLFVASSGGKGGGGTLIFAVLAVAVIVAVLWAFARLSQAPILTFASGRFQLFESWPLTRGKAGKIFLVYIAMGLIVALIELALLGSMALIGLAAGFDMGALVRPAFGAAQFGEIDNPARFLMINGALGALLAMISYPLFFAPAAVIYRGLSRSQA